MYGTTDELNDVREERDRYKAALEQIRAICKNEDKSTLVKLSDIRAAAAEALANLK